ncbi:hypothetical protein BDV37DRAFT_238200, partial [Aspergillus pseudonomiae]
MAFTIDKLTAWMCWISTLPSNSRKLESFGLDGGIGRDEPRVLCRYYVVCLLDLLNVATNGAERSYRWIYIRQYMCTMLKCPTTNVSACLLNCIAYTLYDVCILPFFFL